MRNKAIIHLLCLTLLMRALPAQQNQREGDYTFKVATEIVLVNVVARDKKGNLVRGLTKDDFTILEDGKAQKLASFDFETTEMPAGQTMITADAKQVQQGETPKVLTAKDKVSLDNRRLIVLFFDFSGMEPEEIERAVTAAQKYVDTGMVGADTVSVVTFDSALTVAQDFTTDKALLTKALNRLMGKSGEGFEAGSTGSDTSGEGAFVPEDSDFNTFNTDRKLAALQSLTSALARVEQKKSVIYFSTGVAGNGLENQSQLRATINAAIQSNTAIYTMDTRGLQALPPGGDASTASVRGVAAFSGQSVQSQFANNFATQETLATLASDTGGKAFLDTNDFSQVFKQVQKDTSEYYVLSYKSTNQAKDGRFRKITVKAKNPDVKLEFRNGYYAGRDFAHSTKEDREFQLENELNAELTTTDVRVYVAAAYFRVTDDQYFVPVSIVVPGSEIPFTRDADKDKATLDIIGVVVDPQTRFRIGNLRETVKLNISGAEEVKRKNVQYNTGFLLAPGNFKMKFVVRENQSGRMGSFETEITIPDIKKAPKNTMRLSSVVIGGQMRVADRKQNQNPLIRDGKELVPNITRVFSKDQNLYLYYEVYDAAKQEWPAPPPAEGKKAEKPKQGVRLLSSVQFFSGKTKAFETPLVEVRELTAPNRKAAAFQVAVPLDKLTPGLYTCQVNVIDDAAGTFTFPRFTVLVKDRAGVQTTPATSTTASTTGAGR